MELISIIIPAYNVREYLQDCINSLILQTYKNIEIIIVDDGSADGTGKLCDCLAASDERIKVYHTENGGVSKARNLGISKSNGNYITFVDGDDWVEKNYIEVLYNSLRNCNADISAVGFIYRYSDGKSRKLCITDGSEELLSNEEALNQACDPVRPWVGFACGKLVKKSILTEHGIIFDVNSALCEDILFWYTVFVNSSSAVKNPDMLYNYRIREDSATNVSAKSLKMLKMKILSFKKTFDISKKYPDSEFYHRMKTAVFSAVMSYITSMFTLGQYDKSELKELKSELNCFKSAQVMHRLPMSIKVRYRLFRISPGILYIAERIRFRF